MITSALVLQIFHAYISVKAGITIYGLVKRGLEKKQSGKNQLAISKEEK